MEIKYLCNDDDRQKLNDDHLHFPFTSFVHRIKSMGTRVIYEIDERWMRLVSTHDPSDASILSIKLYDRRDNCSA